MALKLHTSRAHVERSTPEDYYSPTLTGLLDSFTMPGALDQLDPLEHVEADTEVAVDKLQGPELTTTDTGVGGLDELPANDTAAANLNLEQWLPFAAKAYSISPSLKDYFFRTAPLFITDLPNRNGVSFPASELAKWSIDGGCQAYQTWKGKPMHVEHEDEDPTKAIGVIVDVAMVPLKGFSNDKLWKVIALFALDRTKNPRITGAIERGERNTYSMGCLVEGYTCSYCDAEVGKCSHIDPEEKVVFYEHQNQLIFKKVYGVEGREFSSVGDPAFGSAVSDFDGHINLK